MRKREAKLDRPVTQENARCLDGRFLFKLRTLEQKAQTKVGRREIFLFARKHAVEVKCHSALAGRFLHPSAATVVADGRFGSFCYWPNALHEPSVPLNDTQMYLHSNPIVCVGSI